MPEVSSDAARPAGRRLALALLALGGVGLTAASAQTWVYLEADDGLVVAEIAVSGSSLAPLTAAAGIVSLASVLAVLAVRGWLRRLVALVVLALSGTALLQVLVVAVDQTGQARRWWRVEVGALADEAQATTTGWVAVAVVGVLATMAGAVIVLVRGANWSGLSSRYESPHRPTPSRAGRSGSASGTSSSPARAQADAWQALDRGEDPTVDDETEN